eukprot:scaffold6456_cov39-Phaeocystis_antarctica.AAC.1
MSAPLGRLCGKHAGGGISVESAWNQGATAGGISVFPPWSRAASSSTRGSDWPPSHGSAACHWECQAPEPAGA